MEKTPVKADFQSVLGVPFKNQSLLQQALTHSSYVNENPGLVSNERLEFLGDAVLGLIIAAKLYRDYPAFPEGEMTRIRAALVRGGTLTRVAKSVRLGDFLLMGKGEGANAGREKPSNLEAAIEAVIAAVYLDRGLPAAEELVLKLFAGEFEQAADKAGSIDYKSKLQELIQSKYHKAPAYVLFGVSGPEQEREFTVEVRLDEKVLGGGTGRSKKSAEAEAARDAIGRLGK